MTMMNNTVVFARDGRTLVVRNCQTGDGAVLFVTGSDQQSQVYVFEDMTGLWSFQAAFEQFLTETGWAREKGCERAARDVVAA